MLFSSDSRVAMKLSFSVSVSGLFSTPRFYNNPLQSSGLLRQFSRRATWGAER